MIQPVTGTEKFDELIQKGDCLVGFAAPWCGYCHRLRPLMEKLSGEISEPLYGVNIDADKELAERYHVETIPDIFYFHDGKPKDSIIGNDTVGYPELKAFVEKNRK